MPGSVASGTHCIYSLIISYSNLIEKMDKNESMSYRNREQAGRRWSQVNMLSSALKIIINLEFVKYFIVKRKHLR